jgi:hypothetical protein
MVLHWNNGPEWSTEDRAASEAIRALNETLSASIPYIEWPLGQYKRQTGQKRPKDCHIYSVPIAKLVMQAFTDAGEADRESHEVKMLKSNQSKYRAEPTGRVVPIFTWSIGLSSFLYYSPSLFASSVARPN